MDIFLVVFLVGLFYFMWILYIYYQCRATFPRSCKMSRCLSESTSVSRTSGSSVDIRALVVTAHPDDECMFFAPTIIRLLELNASVGVLCLSQGNFYNQGSQRQQELLDSCAVLGIPSSRVCILDHKELPDDPKVEWSTSLTSSLIQKHIRVHSINMVLTFDGRGVSGHANHTAIHKAVCYLGSTGRVPDDCCLMSLSTIGVFRKYLSFLELPISWLLPAPLCCVLGPEGYRQARRAMFCHRTQLLWFRHLYILFSRYMFINTLEIIPQGPKNLKIY